jgi:hypothetical protein
MLWGVEEQVIDRFAKAGIPAENISFARETFTFRSPYSPAEFLHTFKNYYGPTMNAFEAAGRHYKAMILEDELTELFTRQNQSGRADRTSIPATYLKVTVKR